MKLGLDKYGDDDGASTILPPVAPVAPRPVYEGPMPTPPQKPFQPGSTPGHLMHRFMVRVWHLELCCGGMGDQGSYIFSTVKKLNYDCEVLGIE